VTETFHSVRLDETKCKGCTLCIKHCPTEAIRVRDGKARINIDRCIDCGECIRICENHAKSAVTDTLAELKKFKYTIALPAPSLYGQFKGVSVGMILEGILRVGFNEVAEVAVGAEYVTLAIRKYLERHPAHKKPLISSACPAIVRLIQVRFPSLIEHIIPITSPARAIAKVTKLERAAALNMDPSQIGMFFITPCPAKALAVHDPVGETKIVDGAISMQEIYGSIKRILPQINREDASHATGMGYGWARAGGENQAIGLENHLAVDGIHNVIQVLEEIELDKLADIDYVEALACLGGCVGGPLVVENPFVARVRIRKLAERGNRELPDETVKKALEMYAKGDLLVEGSLEPNRIMQLDQDFEVAIAKLEQLEATQARLPGLDCGSCGSPTCRALAEDIVQGNAQEIDCVFKLREQLSDLAQKLVDLAKKVPPAMGKEYAARNEEENSENS